MSSKRMSEFITALETKDLDDKQAQLISDLSFYSHELEMTITAPCGFITDFASVPRLPLLYALFGNIARKPAVIHDYLYQTHETSRMAADGVFLEGMKAIGVPWWKRWDMYIGARIGGYFSYKSGKRRYKVLNCACKLNAP